MTRNDRFWIYTSTLLAGGSGLIYFWMRYLLTPVDEFAIINHPLQPQVQHLHVLTAPLLLFALGLIWKTHIRKNRRSPGKPRKKSGATLYYSVVPMVASGYAIQVSASEQLRNVAAWIHSATSLLFVAVFCWHAYRGYRSRNREK